MGVNSNGTVMMDQGVFENLGSVTWDTTAKTTGFTAVSGNGYFVNTTSGAITVTLPSSPSAGDVVGIKDYANTADTNAITIGRNGSNIDGVAKDFTITTEGLSALLVYVDATKGWLITNSSQASDIQQTIKFVTATGGTITTSGDYKIHTFTGPGTFTVTCAGNPLGSDVVDYLVVAGGGGGGYASQANALSAGGGGAGGFRESVPSPAAWTASPRANPGGSLPVAATGYPITVGGGGPAPNNPSGPNAPSNGSNSIFSTIISTGGGAGASTGPTNGGQNGGSGGGGANSYPGDTVLNGGSGNTPPVSPSQGSNGGNGIYNAGSGGGGGACSAGIGGTPSTNGRGGTGLTTSITTSPVAYAGGGGGGASSSITSGGAASPCGTGGRGGNFCGTCLPSRSGVAGTTNRGGGGGAGGAGPQRDQLGGNGGSGIVIIRYKYQ